MNAFLYAIASMGYGVRGLRHTSSTARSKIVITMNQNMYNVNITPSVTRKEIEGAIFDCSRLMMVVSGVSNNCALLIVGNSLDSVRRSTRANGAVRKKMELVRKEIGIYEYKLEHSPYKFFDTCDMANETRKLYKNSLTRSEYFDYWRATGNAGYTLIKNYIYALRHKYYLIERRSHTEEESAVRADVAIAFTVLSLAVRTWEETIAQCAAAHKLPKSSFAKIFREFSLKNVMQRWETLLTEIFPDINEKNCDNSDKHNIEICANDLLHRWLSKDFITDSLEKATVEYDELFRTKGCLKKVLKSISIMRNED